MTTQPDLDARIQSFYAAQFDEAARLTQRSAAGQVELLRVREALDRELDPSSVVLDVGGATGVHARWLAERGHTVTLVDPVPEQVAAATALGGFAAEQGDARALRFADGSFDAALLFGPLYHLRSREDRVLALSEAHRVLRPGGRVLVSAISRTIALLDIVTRARFADLPGDGLLRLLETGEALDLDSGFPAGHFHTAEELADELASAAFHGAEVTGIEGPGSYALELVPPSDDVVAAGMTLASRAQGHPISADLSGHLLGTATR